VSALCATGEAAGPRFAIADAAVARLFEALARHAGEAVRARYLVGAGQVTARQVEEAQGHLDALAALAGADALDTEAFNARLLDLYRVIPRRMADVRAHLVGSGLDPADGPRLRGLLEAEEETLDVMAAEVRQAARHRAGGPPPTLREALGLTVEPVEDAGEADTIRARMGDAAPHVCGAFRVTDHARQERFDHHVRTAADRTTRLLWHGSRNENWLSILENGLMLRPARAVITGKMFGYGLYFADRFAKSLHYTSRRAGRGGRVYLALYEVHLGRPLRIRQWKPAYAALDADALARRGRWRRPYHSVWGEAGLSLQNNEFIVYHEAQATIRYLVEVAC
jgi:poly [ADP-ribose] polymerase